MTWAECECGREMKPGNGCRAVKIGNEGEMRSRIRNRGDDGETCHDCNVKVGQFHHLGCDMAICPFCGLQESFCDCDLPLVEMRIR